MDTQLAIQKLAKFIDTFDFKKMKLVAAEYKA
jgi:Sec7-like guanine-nucleotide exchange factor